LNMYYYKTNILKPISIDSSSLDAEFLTCNKTEEYFHD
jgi:hypothetical protein